MLRRSSSLLALAYVVACAAPNTAHEPALAPPPGDRGEADFMTSAGDGEADYAADEASTGSAAAAEEAPRAYGASMAAPSPDKPAASRDKSRADSSGHAVPAEARKSAAPAPSRYVAAPSAAPAMKAGRHDDNKEYNRFLTFLAESAAHAVYPVDVSERLVLRALDKDGKSLGNCDVSVRSVAGKTLSETVTYADGRTQFFPAADAAPADKDFTVQARCGAETRNGQASRTGKREVELRFQKPRQLPARVPVDIAIVLDTTGSMQSQIDRLTKTLRAIHFQLTELPMKPDLRFGLVLYRDRGDDYVTRVTGFTDDVADFQEVLEGVSADGGGDTPEDLQQALGEALHELSWRKDALRLGFVVSDAIPHTDYGQQFNYRDAMRESLRRGIKWVTVGAGGLGRDGETIFRQISQFTMAEYVFVTEGGGGDSEGGVGEASHHVGGNYKSENLDQAIVRIVRRELSYLTDAPKDFDDTIVASATGPVARDEVLGPAVEEVLRQLADYSALKLAEKTPIAVIPVTAGDKIYGDVAGYLSERMTLAASRNQSFRVVERDLAQVNTELKLQLSDLFDVTETVPIGKLLGAEALVVSKLTVTGERAALFAKLVRVETGEVLSVSRVELGRELLAAK